MEKLYPDEALFAGNFEKRGRTISYTKELEKEKIGVCEILLGMCLKKYSIANPRNKHSRLPFLSLAFTLEFSIATLAQLVEHSPCKRTVVSSNLTGGSITQIIS